MSANPVTLLLTNSVDYVSDLVVTNLGTEHVFRYNSDLWQDYKLRVTEDEIELENAAGRRITDADVAKVYRRIQRPRLGALSRSPHVGRGPLPGRGDLVGVERRGEHPLGGRQSGAGAALRLDAAGQASAASHGPPLLHRHPFTLPHQLPGGLRSGVESVVKSFNFKYQLGIGFYSQKVREDQLDPQCAWFLTDFVDAAWDVTVVVVRDRLFAFSLDRRPF